MTVEHDRKAVNLRIQGFVQGVGYRAWMVEEASLLGLDGWVRNRRDGSVEALVAGHPTAVDSMTKRCHVGPLGRGVSAVISAPAAAPGASGFRQLPTV